MQHHPVAHINPHMGHRAGAVIGSREKDNVARLCLGGGNDGALVVNALRRGTGQVMDAAGRVHPADKARTVKGGGRAGAAPHISIYLLFLGVKKGAQLFSQAPVGSSSFLRQDTKIPPVVSFGRNFVYGWRLIFFDIGIGTRH